MGNQFIKYLIVGIFNTTLGYGTIFLCMYIFMFSPELSNLIGYVLGMIFSFFANRKFTFKSTEKASQEFIKFIAVCLVAYLANFITLITLVRELNLNAGFSQVISGGVYVICGFLMNKWFVFNEESKKNSLT
jgi:putative flippase GtrA